MTTIRKSVAKLQKRVEYIRKNEKIFCYLLLNDNFLWRIRIFLQKNGSLSLLGVESYARVNTKLV